MKILALLLAMLLTACAGHRVERAEPADRARPTDWGYYNGPVEARWDNDGRGMTLLSELRYVDPKGVVWTAPAGSKVDGASIPRSLWSFMGGPFEGKYRNASVLHDVAYDNKLRPWQEADRMFYNAMRCSGVNPVTAKTMYYTLYRFGRHWKSPKRPADAIEPGSTEPAPADEPPRATAVSPQEVDAIQQWVKANNPSLNQIEARANAEKH